MSEHLNMDVDGDMPPEAFSEPLKALWWLKKGSLKLGPEWERAHAICQQDEGNPDHDWVHALCHLIEEDFGNAAYWFRRARKPSENRDVAAIWNEVAASLS
ncbi:MAG: hypothetical protein JJ979_03465 [Roseibium sp.]|nr:hypothetical protein [Roseibium sp.]